MRFPSLVADAMQWSRRKLLAAGIRDESHQWIMSSVLGYEDVC